ncbi:alanine/glycine:cation symporter family protein [Nesterenkonia sandarakina]|uniref:AGCS family alanine or glycine:cation symporter n=1 Tax=Nesterenkonia sandarakina TaxID=272918 RepID=A0A2T0YRQ7_9MICC|nr:alanine/glycine:cation symporter family protein [Nesterenkonia sandarakina]PRZ18353.1 AGCS family alanine or glycine:cation symporter [Nesterenkonia sandarakina]
MTNEDLLSSISLIEDTAWTWLGIPVIVAVGLYLGFRTRLVQLRHIPDMFRAITDKATSDESGRTRSLSAFQTFTITASARVGTGNIAGVAGAIAMGGPGAVFWMWLMAIFTSAASFVESTLAQLYKVRRFDTFKGGPAYYIERGLGSRSGGIVFAVIFIFCFALSFTSLQSNTIVDAATGAATELGMDDTTGMVWILAVVLAGLTGLVVLAGLRRVAQVSQRVVPIMAMAYILLGLVVVAFNIEAIPAVFGMIFGEAFNFTSAAGGAFGAMIMAGVQRGMFSNEAGMGSVPNVAATADVSHPVKQGLVQTLGVYLDTLIICSVTAFIILVTFPDAAVRAETNVGGELTQAALVSNFGTFGAIALAVIILLLAFTSILGNYSYGEMNVLFISNTETSRKIYAAALTVVVFLGAIIPVDLAWAIAGVTMVIIALYNLVVITLLGGTAVRLLKHYEAQKRQGLEPLFLASDMPDLRNIECWTEADMADHRVGPSTGSAPLSDTQRTHSSR